MRHQAAIALFAAAFWTGQGVVATAQPPRLAGPVVVSTADEELPPISPKTSPGPMSLDKCIELGFQHQPAIAASQASLNAAHTGQRSINRALLARLKPDFRFRREQSSYGVEIAGAAVTQSELETRYAITRNFFSVQYIRAQQIVIGEVLGNLERGYDRAKAIFDAGELDAKITQIDLDIIKVQIGLVSEKKAQADNGYLKALAAVREAMGLGYNDPLEIAAVDLPQAVYEVKHEKLVDKKVKGKTEKVKEFTYTYPALYKFDKKELIASALANRPELVQANSANQVAQLEICAQSALRGLQTDTFARFSDIHVAQIPPSLNNGEYRPGGFAPEYPTAFGGRKADRVQRARDLRDRMTAVLDKAHNLVSLDVEVQYLKWQEAVEDIHHLRKIYDLAQSLPGKVEKIAGKDLTGPAIIQANVMAVMVRTSLNEAMHNHALALAGLERATAGSFRVYPVPAPPQK